MIPCISFSHPVLATIFFHGSLGSESAFRRGLTSTAGSIRDRDSSLFQSQPNSNPSTVHVYGRALPYWHTAHITRPTSARQSLMSLPRHQALRANRCPASFSRIAIGAISGHVRLARLTINVCSSAYWPLKQAWLALSVKTIQVEPAGNSQRSLRQVSWNPASSFMAWWNLSMKRS